MGTITALDKDLEILRKDMKNITELIKKQYITVLESVVEQDTKKALSVIKADEKIDDLTEEVDLEAIFLIAKHQPVATDLRRIITISKLCVEFERIADYAKNVAEYVILGNKLNIPDFGTVLDNMKEMFEVIYKMIDMNIDSFISESKEVARAAADLDEEIDELYYKNFYSLMKKFRDEQRKEYLEIISKALILNKQIERAGDHLTNISEEILYLIKGKRYHLD